MLAVGALLQSLFGLSALSQESDLIFVFEREKNLGTFSERSQLTAQLKLEASDRGPQSAAKTSTQPPLLAVTGPICVALLTRHEIWDIGYPSKGVKVRQRRVGD